MEEFTKEQKEIIAYCVSVMECDIKPNSKMANDFKSILSKFQKNGIWGHIDTNSFI